MAEAARRFRAAVAATALIALVALIPALAGAAPADWVGSKYEAPALTDGQATVSVTAFPITGVFFKTRAYPNQQITSVRMAFDKVRAAGDDSPRDPADPCLPDDIASVPRTTEQDANPNDNRAEYRFGVTAERSTWPCNGRFRVVTTATAAATPPNGAESQNIVAQLTVAVRPVPVDAIGVEVDDAQDRVTITWEKLTEEERAIDAIGYRIERAGPADDDGVYGFYRPITDDVSEEEVAEIEHPTIIDTLEVDGAYRYRVLSIRNGADGPIFAAGEGTAVADATITPDPRKPTTTTTTTEPGSSPDTTAPAGPRIGSGRPIPTIPVRPGASLPAPPTTIDPGFDPELSYDGTRRVPDASPELAGDEGLSFIQNEGGDGPGLVAPVAGAMVLIGWAGHVVYLNRLAKQF